MHPLFGVDVPQRQLHEYEVHFPSLVQLWHVSHVWEQHLYPSLQRESEGAHGFPDEDAAHVDGSRLSNERFWYEHDGSNESEQ